MKLILGLLGFGATTFLIYYAMKSDFDLLLVLSAGIILLVLWLTLSAFGAKKIVEKSKGSGNCKNLAFIYGVTMLLFGGTGIIVSQVICVATKAGYAAGVASSMKYEIAVFSTYFSIIFSVVGIALIVTGIVVKDFVDEKE